MTASGKESTVAIIGGYIVSLAVVIIIGLGITKNSNDAAKDYQRKIIATMQAHLQETDTTHQTQNQRNNTTK